MSVIATKYAFIIKESRSVYTSRSVIRILVKSDMITGEMVYLYRRIYHNNRVITFMVSKIRDPISINELKNLFDSRDIENIVKQFNNMKPAQIDIERGDIQLDYISEDNNNNIREELALQSPHEARSHDLFIEKQYKPEIWEKYFNQIVSQIFEEQFPEISYFYIAHDPYIAHLMDQINIQKKIAEFFAETRVFGQTVSGGDIMMNNSGSESICIISNLKMTNFRIVDGAVIERYRIRRSDVSSKLTDINE